MSQEIEESLTCERRETEFSSNVPIKPISKNPGIYF